MVTRKRKLLRTEADIVASIDDREPSIPLFTGNPAVQFAVQNGTDMMEYVDNYITPKLIQIVVNQTNLYTQ
jgi:hypothetical protein